MNVVLLQAYFSCKANCNERVGVIKHMHRILSIFCEILHREGGWPFTTSPFWEISLRKLPQCFHDRIVVRTTTSTHRKRPPLKLAHKISFFGIKKKQKSRNDPIILCLNLWQGSVFKMLCLTYPFLLHVTMWCAPYCSVLPNCHKITNKEEL